MSEKESRGFTVTDRRTVKSDEEAAAPSPEAAAPVEDAGSAQSVEPGQPDRAALPEIDFGTFVMSLASSALMHLGELGRPGDSGPRINLPLAKQTIDILGMLQEKTRGNLSDEEAQLVEHLLYDLRLKFVDAKKKQ